MASSHPHTRPTPAVMPLPRIQVKPVDIRPVLIKTCMLLSSRKLIQRTRRNMRTGSGLASSLDRRTGHGMQKHRESMISSSKMRENMLAKGAGNSSHKEVGCSLVCTLHGGYLLVARSVHADQFATCRQPQFRESHEERHLSRLPYVWVPGADINQASIWFRAISTHGRLHASVGDGAGNTNKGQEDSLVTFTKRYIGILTQLSQIWKSASRRKTVLKTLNAARDHPLIVVEADQHRMLTDTFPAPARHTIEAQENHTTARPHQEVTETGMMTGGDPVRDHRATGMVADTEVPVQGET